jgi:hypothetical protein
MAQSNRPGSIRRFAAFVIDDALVLHQKYLVHQVLDGERLSESLGTFDQNPASGRGHGQGHIDQFGSSTPSARIRLSSSDCLTISFARETYGSPGCQRLGCAGTTKWESTPDAGEDAAQKNP